MSNVTSICDVVALLGAVSVQMYDESALTQTESDGDETVTPPEAVIRSRAESVEASPALR